MNCKSILLNLDIDGPVAPVTKAAIELAAAHQARLIGFCAAEAPLPMAYPEGGAMFVEAWQQMRTDIGTRFKEMRREFEKLVPRSIDSEWRDALETPTQALVGASRSADLLVMRAAKGASTGDAYRVEQSVRDNASAGGAHVEAYCATCAAPAVRDVLSTGGWRHLFPAQGAQRHVAVVEEAGL
ncbi:MAG: hypothetical protein J0I95_15750 [Microbacterium sp.]|uniref:hypothetical protein n=1 Tax=Microbacterium sp. TaxID=51671 RepID=UPI001AC2D652|nr:hypothetical protein [Microbacterium sp.]MBN9212952.1 hypothetical protein [Microbacterium sp.]